MSVSALRVDSSDRLSELVIKLESLRGRLSERAIINAVETSGVRLEDVAPFILPTPHPYGRRRVARTDDFEVLVMTWLPGQSTGVHDHAGAASVFKILQGTAREMIFEQKPDTLVRPRASRQLHLGDIGCDAGSVIHEVNNDADAELPLVSLHIYAPPLPEMRRFARHGERHESVAAFRSGCDPATPVVAIVGGGFSGTMVAAQVARRSAQLARPLHLVLVDRQT
jgi:Cysteine dioxygenase type I